MKERPILFSGPMVRAILDGRKTQTRRVVKFAYKPDGDEQFIRMQPGFPDGSTRAIFEGLCAEHPFSVICPYGQTGNLLLVKESAWMWCERRPNGKTKTGRDKWHYVPMREAPIQYAADHPEKPTISVVSPDTGNTWGWRMKTGRFLPRWAVRTRLKITAVRVERLQDISEADAIAEGIHKPAGSQFWYADPRENVLPSMSPVGGYWNLWNSINGPGSWDANPWVWVIQFRRVEK